MIMGKTPKEQYDKYNHSEAGRESRRRYKQTPKGQKADKIGKWKSDLKIKLRPDEDWDSVYLTWLLTENCMFCDKDITDKKFKCLDHNHETGFIRGVICKKCNHYRNEVKY
jgi:hypothetical protein